MSEIPDDVMKLAHEVAVYHCGDGLREGARAIANAILADRQRDQWKPIETAPKDNGFLLLYFPKEEGRNAMPAMMRIDRYPVHYPRQPTHWQPLPAAPKGE